MKAVRQLALFFALVFGYVLTAQAVELTHLTKHDAAETATAFTDGTTLIEVSGRTIAWSDLTTAGFANGDDVLILWSFAGGNSTISANSEFQLSVGSTFGGATDIFPQRMRVEAMDNDLLKGNVHMGWVERRTLATNDNIYFSQLAVAASDAHSSNFTCQVFLLDDLAADDFRYDALSSAIAVDTTFATGRDAQITLPATSGDDWLIFAAGDWDVASVTVNVEQQINVDSVGVQMTSSREGEDTNEQHGILSVGLVASAASSQTVTFEGREDASSSNVLDRSRMAALRLGAFESSIFTHTGSGGTTALSTTLNTYVEIATASLSLTTTGPVFVIGETIIEDGATAGSDPYLRLQEGGADIVTNMGLGTDHARDPTDLIGVYTQVIGSMTSGTKTIDMDVARNETAGAADALAWTLAAVSMELAGAPPAGNAVPIIVQRRRR